MQTFLVVVVFFLVFVLLMSIGYIVKKKPISGSCGGLNVAMRDEEGKCMSCGTTVDADLQKTFDEKLGHTK